ncbi:MAG: RHS repeat domain-containing protein [Limisphaerales bacterium]
MNELTANTNGGTLTVMGTTTSQATNVTVNGPNAAHYADATFAATNMPLTSTYTAVATDIYGHWSTNTVSFSLATNVSFQYDANGNLSNDGLRSFAYDDENQLIQVWVPGHWFSQFTYDGKMRRRIRQEFTWQGGAWVQTNAVYYVYDGNLVVQERTSANLPVVTYTRGKDLSGNLDGAGGIGGLLSMTLNTGSGPLSSNSMFYHCDGNGNVTMLLNPSQAVVGQYLYDAFSNTLALSGAMATTNLYRFSSKEWHANSGLAYYLYRYYDPNLQRWPNRDPGLEPGFSAVAAAADTPTGPDPQASGAALPDLNTMTAASFQSWLESLALRERAGQPPYAPSSPQPFDFYTFNLNDGVNHIDRLGLWTLPFFYSCPTPKCKIFVCVGKFETPTRVPRSPGKLAVCLGLAIQVMQASCLENNRNYFTAACNGAKGCLKNYW